MLTTTVTLLLLVLGPVLAAFGVAGFLGNWSCGADHDSLRYLQILAASGRRLIAAGTAVHLLTHGLPAGPLLSILLAAALLAGCTYLTATTNTILPTGATP